MNSADPFEYPNIDANYLRNEEDYETLIKGFEITRKIASQPSLANLIDEHFVDEDIPYPEGSREYIKEYMRSLYIIQYVFKLKSKEIRLELAKWEKMRCQLSIQL